MTWNDWDKAFLALTLWREARGEGDEGMRAVACVVRNRVADTGNWANVLAARLQFSSLTSPGDSMLVSWPTHEQTFQSAMNIAEEFIEDNPPDITDGATHYYNPVTATSTSFQAAVDSGQLKLTKQIGHHQFFK